MRRDLVAYAALVIAAQLACGSVTEPAHATSGGTEVTLANVSGPVASTAGRSALDQPSGSSDTSGRQLTVREREELDLQLQATLAPCPDQPVSLQQCIAEARSCAACVPAGEFLTRLVRRGVSRSQRDELYSLRFDADKVAAIDDSKSPSTGPRDAPVLLVEWVDFQCGHCATMSLLLHLLMERFPGQIRWAQRTYVLPGHAFEPALAAKAAARLGKYWQMHDLMFANQTALSPNDLAAYAVRAGLNKSAFEQQTRLPAVREQVDQDIKAADVLGLAGTPMLYINGRNVPLAALEPFVDELFTWVADEIRMLGMTPKPPSPRYQRMAQELGLQ